MNSLLNNLNKNINNVNNVNRTLTINEIKEAQYIVELAISAIHIVKKMILELKELYIFKGNLDSELDIHNDDIINTNQQIEQIKLELCSIVETYNWKGINIFKSSDWIWNINNNKYTWSFDLQSAIDTLP